ncbi:Rab GTPase [Dictyostelium discoideum AX4]|uniref:Ras-related protein Rab-21 n=1 Tax=Dictyostelium discoideum TaxID=44689 RepID=RAB21_DICDI|nr:Rab GTPase [Dictyostelium discoideum AX4]P34142.2 RecName: Full=Ras-related protein Rab-21; AltName: Full=Ras-related protein RabB [Dictyostelium discoideum]EAL64032.1 Rab GTPase [Dictyostelium discoideum AX4]|eukprot:XP_637605.1 Rab GTPase [Dictyostelium discoideum AX4]
MTDTEKSFKVVLLGEGCVGKTSIVFRYIDNIFNDKHLMTQHAGFFQKHINIGGKRICLTIWDTAGQERFHALGPIYYRGSQGALVVYDITDNDSFIKAKNWIKELKTMLGNDISLCIIGNKCDLEKTRVIPLADAEAYAKSVGAIHYSTSAKLNKGIEELFLDLTRRMILNSSGVVIHSNTNTTGQTTNRSERIPIVPDSDSGNKQPGCCSN